MNSSLPSSLVPNFISVKNNPDITTRIEIHDKNKSNFVKPVFVSSLPKKVFVLDTKILFEFK